MPTATQAALPKPKRIRHRTERDRTDIGTGLVIGRLRHPKDLEARGRGRMLPAFEEVVRRSGQTGPLSGLASIPEGNMRFYLLGVSHKGTPAVVGAMCFGVHPSTVSSWLTEGRDPECPDALKREFARRTDQAVAYGRVEAELEVGRTDPLSALKWGPLGRTTKDVPGWSDERRIMLTDGEGGPPVFRLRLEVGDGYATKPELPPRDVTDEGAE